MIDGELSCSFRLHTGCCVKGREGWKEPQTQPTQRLTLDIVGLFTRGVRIKNLGGSQTISAYRMFSGSSSGATSNQRGEDYQRREVLFLRIDNRQTRRPVQSRLREQRRAQTITPRREKKSDPQPANAIQCSVLNDDQSTRSEKKFDC